MGRLARREEGHFVEIRVVATNPTIVGDSQMARRRVLGQDPL